MTGKGVLRTIGLLGVVACAESTTSPLAEAPVTTSVSLNVAGAEQALDFSADLDKIVEAVIPGFTNAGAGDVLKAQVTALKAQLAENDLVAAAATVADARRELPADAGIHGDIGYVQMVLSNVEAALSPQ